MVKKQIIVYVVAFMVLAGALAYSLYLNFSNSRVVTNKSTTPAGSTGLPQTEEVSSADSCTFPDGSVIYDPSRCEKVKTYRSEKLGVNFRFEQGSSQQNLWGVNLYPDTAMPEMVQFASMINIRPRQNNRSRGVDDPALQVKISNIIQKLFHA